MFDLPNSTQFPNDLVDLHMPQMGEPELKVVLAVLRHTLGNDTKQAALSVRFLAEMTGLSQNSVMSGAKAAIKRGLIFQQVDKKKRTVAIYQPAFRVPHGVRHGASAGEAVGASAGEANASAGEANASAGEARQRLNTLTTTRSGPAAALYGDLFGKDINPEQARELSKLDDHPHLKAILTWAAQEGVDSPRKIMAAARKWNPNPKEKPNGSGNSGRGSAPRQPNRKPAAASNRPTPEQLAHDLEVARKIKERQGRL